MGIEDSKQDEDKIPNNEITQNKDPISSKKKFTYRDMFHPQRLKIFCTLLQHDEMLISHLSRESHVGHPYILENIQYFKDIGILNVRKDKNLKYYSLRKNHPITKSLQQLKEGFDE